MTARRRIGANERAIRKDLQRLPREDRAGGVASLALQLARRLDEDFLPSRDLAAVSAQMHSVLQTLAKKQEPAAVIDPVDELAAKRRRRLGNAAG